MIAAVSSSGFDTGMLQMLQMLQQGRQMPDRGGGLTAQGFGPPSEAQLGKLQAAAEAAGLDTEALESLRGEIESAVSSVIESFDGSGNPIELMQDIQSAVDSVLEENGIDVEQLKSNMPEQLRSDGGFRPDFSQPFQRSFGALGVNVLA